MRYIFSATRQLFTAERVLQAISIFLSIFLIVYLVSYVSDARRRSDCQVRVNSALITSVSASREASRIETQAMDDLLDGLLATPDQDSQELLRIYQGKRFEASRLRVNNPLPDPTC